jgi:hypothetical protein
VAAELSAIETSGAQEKRPELSRRTGGWRSEAPAGWGCPARLLRSSRPVSSQPHVSRPERQVTPPTPAVTRALADNGTISGSTSAPKTPCHRPGSCATPARAGEQWMRGSGARSSGCCGAAPAHWHCVDLAALDNGGRCQKSVWTAEPRKPGERGAPAPQAARAHASLGCEPWEASPVPRSEILICGQSCNGFFVGDHTKTGGLCPFPFRRGVPLLFKGVPRPVRSTGCG